MALKDITDPGAVEGAVEEFDELDSLWWRGDNSADRSASRHSARHRAKICSHPSASGEREIRLTGVLA
jgi:hypothetical protein